MRMRIALRHNDTYLLQAVQSLTDGWDIRPGTFRVAQPYDKVLSYQTPTLNVQNEDKGILKSSQKIHPPPSTPRARKKQRLSGNDTTCSASPDDDVLQWIKSGYNELLIQEETQRFIDTALDSYFYGTYVDAPANEAFALDLVKLQPTLRLLKSGFISSSSLNTESDTDESVVFDSLSLHLEKNQVDLENIFETEVVNNHSTPSLLSFPTESEPHYLIPPHSGFVVSDLAKIHGLKNIAQNRGGFDIIVMDPPWQNASVDRMGHYQTMDLYDLFKIPIPDLLPPPRDQKTTGGIVAVWITNRAKVRKVVVEKLFPAWGLELVAQWSWLKITTGGDPVLSLDNTHRQAYEGILIGKQKPQSSEASTSPSDIKDVPLKNSRKLLVSIPAQHSRKPSLSALLEEEFFSRNNLRHSSSTTTDSTKLSSDDTEILKPIRKLELFARNLEEGVFSWGNEPIRYQYCGRRSKKNEYIQDGYFIPSSESALSYQI